MSCHSSHLRRRASQCGNAMRSLMHRECLSMVAAFTCRWCWRCIDEMIQLLHSLCDEQISTVITYRCAQVMMSHPLSLWVCMTLNVHLSEPLCVCVCLCGYFHTRERLCSGRTPVEGSGCHSFLSVCTVSPCVRLRVGAKSASTKSWSSLRLLCYWTKWFSRSVQWRRSVNTRAVCTERATLIQLYVTASGYVIDNQTDSRNTSKRLLLRLIEERLEHKVNALMNKLSLSLCGRGTFNI